jgi:hypothetical protein
MKMPFHPRGLFAGCLLLLLSPFAAHADEGPGSVLALFLRLPDLPRTAEEAMQWVDPRGQLIHPGLLALNADIRAHQQAVAAIGQAAGAGHRAQSGRMLDDLATGMADSGIDMARLQRDPADALQVQERIIRMSPQEMMAMSQRLSNPLNQDRKLGNEAQAQVNDTPTVQAAAAAGASYRQAAPARMRTCVAQWQEAEAAASTIRLMPQRTTLPKPSPEWENIGSEAACRAPWKAYADTVLPLMIERDTAILRVRTAAWQRQRLAVAEEMKTADPHLTAARLGAASRRLANQLAIFGYDESVIGELLQLIDRMTQTVTSAAAVANCGPQIVLAPAAACR